MTVNTLYVSSLFGDGSGLYNLNAVSSLTFLSTIEGLGTLGYVSVASLYSTLETSLSSYSTAVGQFALFDWQLASTFNHSGEFSSIAFGYQAGYTDQGDHAIGIGAFAGYQNQFDTATANLLRISLRIPQMAMSNFFKNP